MTRGGLRKTLVNWGVVAVGALACWEYYGANFTNRDRDYLEMIAGIVLQCEKKSGNLPDSVDEALVCTKRTLLHRGDRNGNGMSYIKIDSKAFFIRSDGRNGVPGGGDDIDVCVISGKIVSSQQMVEYLKAYHPNEAYGITVPPDRR